jgi:hypothetical protein
MQYTKKKRHYMVIPPPQKNWNDYSFNKPQYFLQIITIWFRVYYSLWATKRFRKLDLHICDKFVVGIR